eukprot:COSAG01_NODE_32_length_35644_cov_22.273738_37_plen_35_part_00
MQHMQPPAAEPPRRLPIDVKSGFGGVHCTVQAVT